MNQSNYALLTALYDSQSSEFYKDIYFPIIKYGIFLLYKEQNDNTQYYDTTNIQDVVIEGFGIKMPLIVIKQSLKVISNDNRPDFTIELLQNGDQFSIKKMWDVSVGESIDRVYEYNLKQFAALQEAFAQYIAAEQLQSDVNFINFFSNNTEDIYHYINNDNNSDLIVNETHIHIANFLKLIKEHNTDLYNIAADIFWGSIIAAFLQREVDLNIKPETQISYYLDSSLILSLLDLDSLANNLYCTELVAMIKASGHLPYVHPLTIREIDSILYSVERDGMPKPNSGISEAFARKGLSLTNILHIRRNLRQRILDCGINIDPSSDAQLDEIQNSYKSKSSVRVLAETRVNTFSDNIRDIHDVYMYDFINAKNIRCVSIEKSNSYFVTLNAELIKYYKEQNKDAYIHPIIHPARIVMDLWIHNSKTVNIRRSVLTEVIARCTALNQTDVRRKLRLISKHYKEDQFTAEKYRVVYMALMSRSRQVISEIDAIQNIDMNEADIYQRIENIIRIALQEDEQRRSQNLEHQRTIESLTKDIEEEARQRNALTEEYAKTQKLLKLTEELNQLNIDIANLEKERDQSVSMWRYGISILVQGSCTLLIIVFGSRYLLNLYKGSCDSGLTFCDFVNQNIVLAISIPLTILSFIISGLNNLSIFRPQRTYKNHRKKLQQEWEDDNPEYEKIVKKRERIESNIAILKER